MEQKPKATFPLSFLKFSSSYLPTPLLYQREPNTWFRVRLPPKCPGLPETPYWITTPTNHRPRSSNVWVSRLVTESDWFPQWERCFSDNTQRIGGKTTPPESQKSVPEASQERFSMWAWSFLTSTLFLEPKCKILIHYLQENILKRHLPTCHQVGTKPETGSVGKIHHCLGEGECDSKDVCFLQRVSEKKTFGNVLGFHGSVLKT